MRKCQSLNNKKKTGEFLKTSRYENFSSNTKGVYLGRKVVGDLPHFNLNPQLFLRGYRELITLPQDESSGKWDYHISWATLKLTVM